MFVIGYGLICACFWSVAREYFPAADAITEIAESTPYAKPLDVTGWFTRGWHGYCKPYAEYTGTPNDFIRPVANPYFLLIYLVFRDHWAGYLFLNFAVMAAAASLSYYVARWLLGCRLWTASLASLLVLLNPAAVQFYNFSPGYITGTLSALLAALAIVLVAHKRVVACLVILLVALFTKESAAFAPAAAGLTYLVMHAAAGDRTHWRRQALTAAAITFVPLGFWWLARRIVFHGAGQVYIVADLTLKRILISWATCPSVWPLGLTGPTEPSNAIRDILLHHQPPVSVLPLIALGVNVLAVLAGIWVMWRAAFDRSWREQNARFLMVGSWIALALCMLVSLGLPLQNGPFVYIAGMPLTCLVLERAVSKRSVWVSAMMIAFQAIAILPMLYAVEAQFGTAAADASEDRRMTESLMSSLVEAGRSHDRVYVLNDIPIRNAGRQIAAFAGTKAEVVVLNNINVAGGMPHDALKVSIDKITPNRYRIKTTLAPPCELCFVAASWRELLSSPNTKISYRNKNISYEFPNSPAPRTGFLGTEHWQVGDTLITTLSDDSNFAIVGYDPDSGLYRVLRLPD